MASAKKTDYPAHTLPHWLVRDFITEFCHFFNVTLVVDQEARTAVVVPNAEYFDTLRALSISPVDDYQADLSDDGEAHALAADNLRFDLSGSDCHDYDVIGDALRQSLPSVAYGSRTAARQAFEAMDERQQMAQLFTCPDGRLAGWDHDYSDIGGGTRRMLTQVDVFGPLVRDPQSDSETLLKIVPVAISDSETLPYSEQLLPDDSPRMSQSTCRMPSLENPTGHEHIAKAGGDEDQERPTMQDYISGEASIEQAEKEDRLQVMFVDSVLQTSVVIGGDWAGEEFARMMGFTDHQYKKNHKGNDHRRWSLSLNPTDADHYLGQLHQLGFTFNMKARHCFRFLAEEMPDPTRVYNIRGKLYGCEKIEANITEDGLDRLMTGYFYEMTDRAQL